MSAPNTVWLIAAFAVGAVFIPLRSLDSPAWDVWVADQSKQPVSGITVRLTYKNYSAEQESHEIDATTNAQGHVAFKAQTFSASLGLRIAATLQSAAAGVHASFGPHATLFAFGNGLQGFAVAKRDVIVDWTGKPGHMESWIILTPRKL